MEEVLMSRFQEYVVRHNPELVLKSRDSFPASRMIRERVESVLPTLKFLQDQGRDEADIISICMEILTRDLRPSKADYIRELIRTEFPVEHAALIERGLLTEAAVELMGRCSEHFVVSGFGEHNDGGMFLVHAIIAETSAYLNSRSDKF